MQKYANSPQCAREAQRDLFLVKSQLTATFYMSGKCEHGRSIGIHINAHIFLCIADTQMNNLN